MLYVKKTQKKTGAAMKEKKNKAKIAGINLKGGWWTHLKFSTLYRLCSWLLNEMKTEILMSLFDNNT